MKKLLFIAALAAAVACTKENQNQEPATPVGEDFSKAEITFKVLNSAETGPVDPSFFDYVTFDVQYKEFAENNNPENDKDFIHPDSFKKVVINASNTSMAIIGTKKADAKKDYCADIVITPVFAATFPATLTVDFALICKGVIYDAGGKAILSSNLISSRAKGPTTETKFKDIFKNEYYPDWKRSRISYGYFYSDVFEEWLYNFGICPLKK